MAVQIVFLEAKSMGSMDAPGVGAVRHREAVALDATSTGTVRAGEAVMVYNSQGSAILAAHGTEPDASAADSTDATSAGVPIAADQYQILVPAIGAKISVKALA